MLGESRAGFFNRGVNPRTTEVEERVLWHVTGFMSTFVHGSFPPSPFLPHRHFLS